MKDPLVKGHPIHAMLSDIPIGATITGIAFDALAAATRSSTRRREWAFAARGAFGMGVAGGLAAALTGLWDYQAVPREHPTRRTGAVHGWTNAAGMTLLAASVALRSRGRLGAPHPLATGCSLAGFGILTVGGWLGGEVVFREGWRVVPAEHAEQLEAALREQGDKQQIERAHRTVWEYEQEHALIP